MSLCRQLKALTLAENVEPSNAMSIARPDSLMLNFTFLESSIRSAAISDSS